MICPGRIVVPVPGLYDSDVPPVTDVSGKVTLPPPFAPKVAALAWMAPPRTTVPKLGLIAPLPVMVTVLPSVMFVSSSTPLFSKAAVPPGGVTFTNIPRHPRLH
jgi:hypothetical protein